VGVNYEPHHRALTPCGWNAALDFADQQLCGLDQQQSFDHFPPEHILTNNLAPK
jgi:hypothetical protein